MKYYSQYKQDEILYQHYFHKLKHPGFFIEIGAHNGEYLSNTLYYEESLNWKGICIEASPLLFEKCEKRRKCLSLNYAICNKEGEAQFMELIGDPNPLSGLIETYDPRHIQRIDGHIQQYGGDKNFITVKTCRLQTILDKNDIKEVHYISIDTEGSELDILYSIDFNKTFIHIIEVENNYPDKFQPIIDLLTKNGFIYTGRIECDEVFIHTKSNLIN